MVQKIVKLVLLSVVVVILVGVIFGGVSWFSQSVLGIFINKSGAKSVSVASLESSVDDNVQAQVAPPQTAAAPSSPASFASQLSAQSALSLEFGGSLHTVLFQKNPNQELPVASLTKLMTALVVLQHYNLAQEVTVDSGAMAQEGEQGDLQLGQVLSVKDLLYITLIESSNRSAYQLSEVVGADNFVDLMNTDASALGLNNTHFVDSSGLDSGSYSTVSDLAKLTEYVFENYPLFREIIGLKTYNLYLDDGTFHHTLINTNELLGTDNIIGGKTGFTDDAKGCLMVIQQNPQNGNDIISILLGSNDRFGEMQRLISH